MKVDPIPPHEFLAARGPILDVRSPTEFEQGHIPGAVSFPIFSDQERRRVGRCYTQVGPNDAVELGFELAGPKCAEFVRRARALTEGGTLRVHCWRGGMRSQSMAWVLSVAGLEVRVLDGGYKAYKRWTRDTLSSPRRLVVLAGMTGTAKTELLRELATSGEAVIDLEGLANHRGSAFGGLCMPEQPSTEHLHNMIAASWDEFRDRDTVWIEGESRRVGKCHVPDALYAHMQKAPTIEVVRSEQERIEHLAELYGDAEPADLIASTERIRKRLGGQHANAAIEFIERGQLREACSVLLAYYDRTYRHELAQRTGTVTAVDFTGMSIVEGARTLQAFAQGVRHEREADGQFASHAE